MRDSPPPTRDDQLDWGTDWYRNVDEATPDAVVTMDQDGRVVDWSPQAQTLFGYSRQEAVGRLLASLIVPERYRDAHWAGLERFRETGEARVLNQRLELSAVHRDGSEFPIELTITLLRLADVPLFVGFIRKAGRRSPGSQRRARMVLESRLLHQVTNLSTSAESFEEALQKCVEVMCSVTGWPVGHVLVPGGTGRRLQSTDIWHFADEDRFAGLRDASRGKEFRRGQGLPGRIWQSGEAVWSSNVNEDSWFLGSKTHVDCGVRGAFGFPVSVNGETVAVLEFFTPDEVAPDPQLLMLVGSIGTQLGRIIERRQWEDDRARLAAIVDGSYDAIIGKSLDGTIISWNTGAEQTYGFTAEEAIGNSISLILPDEARDEEAKIRQAMRTGRRLIQFETRRKRKDGVQITVAVTVSPIRDSHGRIVGLSAVERDITRRKQRELELEAAKAAAEQAREAAEAANRTKTEFLANISHELRTPMNAIIGMLELALGEELTALMEDYLRTAHDSAHTLLYLLDDLLDFSRMEAGRFELETEPFPIRQVVDGIVKTLSLRAYEKGLELATRVEADVPERLEGDGRRLRQVLMNLAGNAIKFTEQGEILVSVAVESRTEETVRLLFSVKDTGMGISSENQKLIFSPFTQVDASTTRQQSGSGLGLAICRELVEKMNGRIWLESSPESSPEKGTTFYFTAQFRVLPELSLPTPRTYQLRDLPVLVVDDNQTNLAILRETLTSWDMAPSTSTDARVGLERLRAAERNGEPFAIVIVDALMPDVDGFTLVETMHNEGLTATAAVLMLSSADRHAFRDRCEELPVDVFLEKPVSQSDLLEAVVQARFGSQPEPVIAPHIDQAVRTLRVLLAEDTPANQKVVRAMLEKRGHQVAIADNGREALERLRQEPFDTVLMDVQMPTMDGLQATAAIREMPDPLKANVPIVAMTAHARRQDRHRCRQAGMDAYLSKPIDFQRLIHVVETTRHPMNDNSAAPWLSDPAMEVFPPRVERAVAPEDPVRETHVIDHAAALKRLGGKEELFASLAGFFLNDSPELLQQIRDGLQSEDAELVARAAHSLKGLSANFDAHAVGNIARQIEDLGRDGKLKQAARLVPKLVKQVRRLQDELRQFAPQDDA